MTDTAPAMNLLPWRSQLRRRRCRTFNFLMLVLLVIVGLLNAAVVVVMRHDTEALIAVNEGSHRQLEQVLAERDRLTDPVSEVDAQQHWVNAGQWLESLALTTPDGVRWRALQWHHPSDHWQLQFEMDELAAVAPWASAWEADLQLSEQGHKGLIEGVMVGQLSSLRTLQWGLDHALVD